MKTLLFGYASVCTHIHIHICRYIYIYINAGIEMKQSRLDGETSKEIINRQRIKHVFIFFSAEISSPVIMDHKG